MVSEEGLERLVKRTGLECIWENDMDDETKKTLIVAGSALELLIVLHNHVVQSVSLNFPDSAEMVNKHAVTAGEILFDNLRTVPGQLKLTKRLDKFAANFERLAVLDKLSINPGLNLYEGVAGIYESLARLHQWELQKAREDPTLAGKGDEYLQNIVRCVKSGEPGMNLRGRVCLSVDFWREQRLLPPSTKQMSDYAAETEKSWALLVSCTHLRDLTTSPVRISDKWIAPEIEKMPGLLGWEEPPSTFLPAPEPDKEGDALATDAALLGPRLPEVSFLAAFDPPIQIDGGVWQTLQQMGIGMSTLDPNPQTYDSLLFPVPAGTQYIASEPRVLSRHKKIEFRPRGEAQWSLKHHSNTLYVYKPSWGKTLSEVTLSHPRLLVNMLPSLRQFAFLSTLLQNSFGEKPDPPEPPATSVPTTTTDKTTTSRDQFAAFMAGANGSAPSHNEAELGSKELPLQVDVTLNVHPIPRLQIVFPFRSGTASVDLEIQENGRVHVESQNILDASNTIGANGRQRSAEDLGKLLETFEDIGKWCEFIRTRWA